jgi:hypothetical protein
VLHRHPEAALIDNHPGSPTFTLLASLPSAGRFG